MRTSATGQFGPAHLRYRFSPLISYRLWRLVWVTPLAAGMAAFGTDQPWKNTEATSITRPEPSVRVHVTRASTEQRKTGAIAEPSKLEPAEAIEAPPTRSSFRAKWAPV